jgi:D-glycero-alpha-D-manno-heptose-7-phosphate kinase
MIISRTPFRISFFGGGTDFPGFFREHGGATLATTIDKYCYLLVHTLSPLFEHRFAASYSRTEQVREPIDFEHPLIRECLLHTGVSDGIEIDHVSDLPARTGLGSSSSFTVGLLNALYTFAGQPTEPEDLAREAILIERTKVGDPGGWQDQYAAAYGGLNRLDFTDDHVHVKRLPLVRGQLEALEKRLMLFYTGLSQGAGHILEEQKERMRANEKDLLRMVAMVDQAERLLVENEDLDGFGDLLHDTWELKKTLAPGISNETVDSAYEAARAAGARGGKLLGAGGRGFLLVYAAPEKHAAIRAKLSTLQEVPIGFSNEGSRIIFATPG